MFIKIQLASWLLLLNNFCTTLSNNPPTFNNTFGVDYFSLHSPIKFTASGIQDFLKNTYNHTQYASNILPHNTSHFLQLLEHGQKTKLDQDYMLAVIRLFRQKINSASFLTATEVERVTALLPKLLNEHLKIKVPLAANANKLNIVGLRLIENCLSKTLWSGTNPQLIWPQFINIGNSLNLMFKSNQIILDTDDLNDALHILIDRLIYTIKLLEDSLPESFYTELSKQLQTDPPKWLEIDELEDLIDSKLQKIKKAVLQAQVKAQAKAAGIL